MPTRREFLTRSAFAGTALSFGMMRRMGADPGRPDTSDAVPDPSRAARSLNLLILGGTGFTGPNQVDYALERGHKVTILHRGKTRPGMFKGKVDELFGDLNDDVSALRGRDFDVVIDNPTTLPFWVRNAAQYIAGHTRHYVFISTLSVYPDNSKPGADESAPTTPLSPAPGAPDDPVQFIDARDLAEWTIRMAEMGPAAAGGIYNATGPRTPLSMAEMLYGIKAITTSDPHFVWVPWAFLQPQKVRPWRDMPVWIPPGPDTMGFHRRNTSRALAKGLTFRPLAVTAKETLDWNATRSEADRNALLAGEIAGMSAQRESEVLAVWHAEKKA